MQDYVVITDSTADLSLDLINELNIKVVPLNFSIGGRVYADFPDEKDMSRREFYEKLRNGERSTTSQVNPEDFLEIFGPYLEDGKDIIYVAFSSGLSGTYSSAKIAAEGLLKEYPNRKIKIVDSLCASMGEGLLVYLAVMEKRNGASIDELEYWLNKNKLHICHWFTVDDLGHLHRGGRVSSTAAFIGGMLNIKPILHVDNDGKLVMVEKTRGRRKSIDLLLSKMERTALNLEGQTIFISHGDCADEIQNAVETIKNKYKVKRVVTNTIGPVIGSHSGPGTVALFFMGTVR